MLADDPNFFSSHQNIEGLLYTVKSELEKFTLFQKNYFKNEVSLKVLALMIGNNNTERKSSIKFLGVILDEHISSTDHVKAAENKIVKNIDLLYRVSQFLN